MPPSRVTTIVVNWKLKEETGRCLHSLLSQDAPGRVLVIDNGSADGSVEYLATHFPAAEVLVLPVNVGFGAACNRGITEALRDPACDYILLLNNDATLPPHGLSQLSEMAEAHPQVGIFGPKIHYRDLPNVVWYAGARRRRGVLAAADTGQGQTDRGQFDAPREVDYVFGAAMFIRRQVFEQVGVFDETYFLYLEDLDFCLRAQQGGFALLFVPQVCVQHKVSASTDLLLAWRRYHYVRSTLLFLRKHATLIWIGPVLIFWFLVLCQTLAPDLARGDWGSLRSCWSGLLEGLGHMAQPKRVKPKDSGRYGISLG